MGPRSQALAQNWRRGPGPWPMAPGPPYVPSLCIHMCPCVSICIHIYIYPYVSHVPCPVSRVLCPVSRVPCPVSHVPCPVSSVPCAKQPQQILFVVALHRRDKSVWYRRSKHMFFIKNRRRRQCASPAGATLGAEPRLFYVKVAFSRLRLMSLDGFSTQS